MTFGGHSAIGMTESLLYLPFGGKNWKLNYVCRGCFADNLKYNWLMIMSLD